MTARPGDYVVQTRHIRACHWLLFLLLGIVLGGVYAIQAAPEPVVDNRMQAACSWPKHEGEMTVVTVLNGKLVCWRFV